MSYAATIEEILPAKFLLFQFIESLLEPMLCRNYVGKVIPLFVIKSARCPKSAN